MLETLMSILIPVGIAIAVILLIVILFKCFWKVAGTNEVLIASGLGKVKTRSGGGMFVLPIIQKTQRMTLENIQVDFTSRNEIPTKDAIHVLVDAVANMAISKNPERQAVAASKFAGYSIQQIRDIVIPVLEGNIREIISQTEFEDLIRGDKKAFAEKIQENVTPNLADLGIDLTTFNIQNFSDKNGVIRDLGIENIEKIKKEASIAAARAKAEVAIESARADKEANDAKVEAATEIARKQTDFAVKKAEMQKQADTEQAKADAAKQIEAENQRREQEIATANANLARQEKEIELKAREVEIKERALEAEVKKTAEAKKYAEQQAADAALYKTQKSAEADLFERQRQAEAAKIEAEKRAEADLALANAEAAAKKALAEATQAQGEAEAAAAKAKGLAEAEAIRAKAEAEAEGLLKKAEAMKLYGEAAMADRSYQALESYFAQLPAIAAAIGEGYKGVDKIVMLGNDSNQLAGNIINSTTQISEGLSESLGIDLKTLLTGFLGGKIALGANDN
ncbi:MAG: flotillin family protein, partial [Tyzzerella sp.]|nr:flotillin family protein [Tyzzerella sp.]